MTEISALGEFGLIKRLTKDLKTNTKYYLREEYFNGKVTLYYYTKKDIKKLGKKKEK